MLTIRIIKLPDGVIYTALSGADGTIVFEFDRDTGDDREVLAVELGQWDSDEIMLEHLTV